MPPCSVFTKLRKKLRPFILFRLLSVITALLAYRVTLALSWSLLASPALGFSTVPRCTRYTKPFSARSLLPPPARTSILGLSRLLFSSMADTDTDNAPPEPESPPIKFEFAASARSTCKRSGEKIAKGEPRMGVANPQHKNSYGWYKIGYNVAAIKQPKTKNGLTCKITKEKFFSDMLVLGYMKSTVTVSADAYAAARKKQTGTKEEKVRRRDP